MSSNVSIDLLIWPFTNSSIGMLKKLTEELLKITKKLTLNINELVV